MSKPHIHEMAGLKPDALATYLTALGIFRLLVEQKDPHARGFWRDEHFVLVTDLDWDAIERFLLQDYTPTPILAPWNLESGLFSLKPPLVGSAGPSSPTETLAESEDSINQDPDADADLAGSDSEPDDEEAGGDDEVTGDPLIERIRRSVAARLASFRRAIEVALDLIPEELRQAERDTQQAHQKMRDELAGVLAEHRVSDAKADVDAQKASVRGTKRGVPSGEVLAQARTRLKQAEETLKKKKAELKTKEKELKAPIEAAKKRFKETTVCVSLCWL